MNKAKKFFNSKIIPCLIILLFAAFIMPAWLDAYAAGKSLVPVGKTSGIILNAEGVMITGFSNENGASPAKNSGLKVGDVIISVDSKKVTDKNTLSEALLRAEDEKINVEIMRGKEKITVNVNAIFDPATGSYLLGIKAKDTVAGIGTITYIDPETNKYGALGHGICDPDTALLLPYSSGKIVKSEIVSVNKGKKGTPGELVGSFDINTEFGTVCKNSDCGLFGNITDISKLTSKTAIETASANEISEGDAVILSNIAGSEVKEYKIRINKIYKNNENIKQMLIEVTDKELLEKTGGIVQGMSGSPILQNGKLVGAVTHVLVNDPTKGYGIFIDSMLDAAA